MEKDLQTQFNTILERFGLSKDLNWKPLQDYVELAEYNMPLPAEEDALWNLDAEELIRLIKLVDSSSDIQVQGDSGSKPIKIQDSALLKYLLLSLHKLLQLKLGIDKLSKKELKKGEVEVGASDTEGWVKVGIKKALKGEDSSFIEPYNEEELNALLGMFMKIKQYQKIREGRGKNVAFYGDKVAEALASIPEEAKDVLNKTDLLNFVGEIMDLAGFLKDVHKWKELSDELALRERKGLIVGDIRKERKKLLENWLKGAKEIYCKSELQDSCKQCKDFEECIVSRNLKYYDI